jgi:hypothetical protein
MTPGADLSKSNQADSSSSRDEPSYQVPKALDLQTGKKRNPLAQALTIFHKRCWIFRRSWISLSLGLLVAICGSCIPLFFLISRTQSCEVNFEVAENIPLFLPLSPLYGTFFGTIGANGHVLESPTGVISSLGSITNALHFTDFSDRSSFVTAINNGYRNLTLGGIAIPPNSSAESALLAWEASSPGLAGASLVNLVSNILWKQQSNGSGSTTRIVSANYQAFPAVDGTSLGALKWVAFFGATMVSVFFSLLIDAKLV